MATPPFKFQEDNNQVFYHNVKIFIFGTDVTPWLTGQITNQRADRDGINSLNFSLTNTYRAFEITETNLGISNNASLVGDTWTQREGDRLKGNGPFRLTNPYAPEGIYSELAKAQIFNLKKNDSRNSKHKVQTLAPVTGGNAARIRDIPNDAANLKDSFVTRYPMTIGSLVFHKYDPVRFFVKNPLSRETDEWTCEFTGYLDSKPFTQNYVTGESVINITCQDIRVLMNMMRVHVNPVAQVGNENMAFFGTAPGQIAPDTIDAGLFNDLRGTTSNSHILADLTFIDSLKTLLFGTIAGDGNSRKGAIGKIKEGITVTYSPGDTNALEKWNNIVTFGSLPLRVAADLEPLVPENNTNEISTDYERFPTANKEGTLSENNKFLTLSEMYNLGIATTPDKGGSPDAARVHFLIPAEGTPTNNMIEYSVDTRVVARTEFASRLELLNQLLKGIDYQMCVTGLGDIVFEFPMYDFMPNDYNETYNKLYTFDKHIIADNINDEGGSAISALQITSRGKFTHTANKATGSADNSGSSPQIGEELRHTIFSNVLASRIGPIIESFDLPGITNPERLAQLGHIEFNKRNANFNPFDIQVSYRPWLNINRPIYHVTKARMAIISSLTYVWRIREEVSLELGLVYPRKLEGDAFRFITGGERMPISYKTIYDGTIVPKQGVNDDTGTTETTKPQAEPTDPNSTETTEGNPL